MSARRRGPVISLMLAVPDAPKAAAWYAKALGAVELWNLGSVIGLDVGGAPLFLGEPENNGWSEPSSIGTTTVRVEVFVDDPDSFVARAVAAGADGTRDPVRNHQLPWGVHRQGAFVDPFGHLWLVGDRSPLAPLPAPTLTPNLITLTSEATRSALEPLVGADWSKPAPGLEWSCWRTGVHLADGYVSHAAQVLGRPPDRFLPIELTVNDDAGPAQLLEVLATCADLLRCAVVLADPADRSWHPWGVADPLGSLAIGVVEGLVHTYDIAAGLGVEWRPPADLCRPVLRRLFPDAPGGDPTDVLLWCTGRAPLPGRPRLTTWRWDSSVRPPPAS
jgi:uncharacterized glyoxalase superfamily protein PhnB